MSISQYSPISQMLTLMQYKNSKFWIYCNMRIILIIVSVRKVKLYIGNEEIQLRELTNWDEDLLDRESVIYCGVEGIPSPNYTIYFENRDEKGMFLTRDYFPYFENEDTNTRWAAFPAADIEWGREFNLTCVASLGNESISATSSSWFEAVFSIRFKFSILI